MESLHGGEIFLCTIRARVQLQGAFWYRPLRNLQTNTERDDNTDRMTAKIVPNRVKNFGVRLFPTLAVRQSAHVRCDGHQLQSVDEQHAAKEATVTLVVAAVALPFIYHLCHIHFSMYFFD